MEPSANFLTQDRSNPYYFHPDDFRLLTNQPCIISEMLSGPNYDIWSQQMTTALQNMNKFVFLDGTIKKPDSTDPHFEAWKKCNEFLLQYLRCTVSELIRYSIKAMNDASVIWEDLKDRYSHGRLVRIYQLNSDIFSLKQGDSSVLSYYTKLQHLICELNVFQPLDGCPSSHFGICKAFVTAVIHRMDDYALYFLQGLNDDYADIRSQILSKDRMPLPIELLSMIREEEEKQLKIKVRANPNVVAQLPQSDPAGTSHTSNLVSTDSIIASSSISSRVKFLDFSSIMTYKSKEEPKAALESDRQCNLTLGSSFKDESSNKYCTLRYEFKPASADSTMLGLPHKTEEKSISAEFQNNQIGKPNVAFEGNSEEHKEGDAVLFFDGKTLRLELLHKAVEQLRHIQMPGESSTAAAKSGADSSPFGKFTRRALFNSDRSADEAARPLPVDAAHNDIGEPENAAIKADSNKSSDDSSEPSSTGTSPAVKNVQEHQGNVLNKRKRKD